MAGTMRERTKNHWLLEYMYKGTRYSTTVVANSKTEASKKLALFVVEVESNSYFSSNLSFTELAQMFIDKHAKNNLSESTIKNYKYQLNKHILPAIGTYKINALKKLHIQDLANNLLEEYNLSSKTIKNDIKLISAILEKGIEWELLNTNVAHKVSIPINKNKPKKEQQIYNNKEIKLLFKALEKAQEPFKTMVYVSFFTGARRGEVLALRWKDIDFKNNIIHIEQNKIQRAGGTSITTTKNKKTRRFTAPDILMTKLKEYYNNQNEDELLFNMYPSTYTRQWIDFVKENNLKYITLHDLRHTNGSILASKGVDIVTIAKRLGHLPATASSYYLHAVSEEDRKASKKLEKLF